MINSGKFQQRMMTHTESLVKNMVDKFQEKGLKVISANCEGFPKPTNLQGAVPDVVGWDPKEQLLHLGIVADSTNIASDFTREKMSILAKLMIGSGNAKGKHIPFYIGVTKEVNNATDIILEENNLALQDNIERILI